jgi:hypothetical protein
MGSEGSFESEIDLALDEIGADPPSIDVWRFGLLAGRVVNRSTT